MKHLFGKAKPLIQVLGRCGEDNILDRIKPDHHGRMLDAIDLAAAAIKGGISDFQNPRRKRLINQDCLRDIFSGCLGIGDEPNDLMTFDATEGTIGKSQLCWMIVSRSGAIFVHREKQLVRETRSFGMKRGHC